MRYIFLFITLLFTSISFGQGLTAFQDFRKNFVIFDNGHVRTVEYQPIQSYQIGGKLIPYIDNMGYFKIYNNGKVDEITYGPNIDYIATDHLVSYFVNDQLWAYENGKKKLLSVWVNNFKVSDYTIAYLDNNNNSFSMYQNGKITKLENVLTDINVINYAVGENIIAYNYLNEFKINFQGENFVIDFNNEPQSYKVGRNTVAWLDAVNYNFQAFYNGEIYTLEDFHPNWYAMGDNMVLYKDQLNNLKVFSQGKITSLSNGEVTDVNIQDNICSYMEQGQFKIFFNGEIKTLEYNRPSQLILENNSVVYLDQTKSLKYFDGQNGKIITSERITNFDVNLNTVTYQNSANRSRVFYKGKIY